MAKAREIQPGAPLKLLSDGRHAPGLGMRAVPEGVDTFNRGELVNAAVYDELQ